MSTPHADGSRVRDADPDRDAAACLEIYAPYVRETAVSFEDKAPSLEEFRERIRALAVSHCWLVLDTGAEIAGYAYASPHRSRAAYRWAVDVAVYVAPAHQRAGVGRRLYTELLERLRERRFQVACAGITTPNDGSVGLHRAMGFELVGTYRRIGWKLGAWHDVSWWQLDLAAPTDAPPAEPLRGTGRET